MAILFLIFVSSFVCNANFLEAVWCSKTHLVILIFYGFSCTWSSLLINLLNVAPFVLKWTIETNMNWWCWNRKCSVVANLDELCCHQQIFTRVFFLGFDLTHLYLLNMTFHFFQIVAMFLVFSQFFRWVFVSKNAFRRSMIWLTKQISEYENRLYRLRTTDS